ncbi:MAG: hypothetical protein GU346_05850 [Thermocrinis sp.]|jgi:hypothetical protein|nr:hypothetical protein [Thermocrinis sp.]
MVNHVATYGNTLSLYFDSVEGKILFKSRVEGLKGITIEKEGYKTLKLKVEDQALLESLRKNLERRESLTIEDLHCPQACLFYFYLWFCGRVVKFFCMQYIYYPYPQNYLWEVKDAEL